MSVSRLLSRVPVGRTLAVVLVLLVALAALDGWAESHRNIVLRVNEICFYLGSLLAVAFIWLLVRHLVASTRRRQFKRLAVHLVTVPVGVYAYFIIFALYSLRNLTG